MYVQTQQLGGLGKTPKFIKKIGRAVKKVAKPVAAAAAVYFTGGAALAPMLALQAQKKQAAAARAQAAAMQQEVAMSVPSGDVALARALAQQQASDDYSASSDRILARRAAEAPAAMASRGFLGMDQKTLLLAGGGVLAVALVAALASRRG